MNQLTNNSVILVRIISIHLNASIHPTINELNISNKTRPTCCSSIDRKIFNIICNSNVMNENVENIIVGQSEDERIPCCIMHERKILPAINNKSVSRHRSHILVTAEKSIDDSFLPFPLFRRLSAMKSSQARIDCPRREEIDVVKRAKGAERFAIRVRHPRRRLVVVVISSVDFCRAVKSRGTRIP